MEMNSELTFVAPQKRPAADGVEWLADSFKLFRQSSGPWIMTMVVGLILAMLIGMVPVLGQLASMLTTYVWTAGIMLGCHAMTKGDNFDVKYLFAGFTSPQLLSLVALSAGMTVISSAIALMIMGPETMAAITGQAEAPATPEEAMEMLKSALVSMLVTMPLVMAAWFAAPLIAINKLPVWEACRLSFTACIRNVWAMTVYGVLLVVIMFLSIMTMGVGLLVAMPMFYASIYCSYRRIFYDTGEFYF